jgi:hypothetical protein
MMRWPSLSMTALATISTLARISKGFIVSSSLAAMLTFPPAGPSRSAFLIHSLAIGGQAVIH